ncbi:probable apyrase 7 isoform X1 [Benincasa hispida]|uniref:probable apyrase 7 isoform X1 n=1 Tax=Benincasa hispida TaxID=102211 RepID=UPI001901AD32|nr:probable apyrase 7 isoform X1 [Benincasa hispida]
MDLKSHSKLKLSPTRFTKHKWILNITVLVVVTFVISRGAILAYKSRVSNAPKELYYTVVVDCGSTGTRIDVYEWKWGEKSGSDLPVLLRSFPNNSTKSPLRKKSCSYHCMQTQPGLDKFVGNISGVRVSLNPLIEWAEQEIPVEKHSLTPIFVLSTAGLRRLANEDAKQVLEDIEAVLKGHSFMYRKSWIRVLSGIEEAYYGWVALNYKMGSFRNSSRSGTLGILDLGGSSLQVVMESDHKREEREEMQFMRSKVGSIEHQVLAFSWEAFGLIEAFDRTLILLNQTQVLGKSNGTTVELRHPCLSSSFMQKYTCYNCLSHDNSGQVKLSHQISKTGFSFYLVGKPNWEQCKRIARAAAINSSSSAWSEPIDATKCLASPSSSNGGNNTVVVIPTTRFHALSGFFAVYQALNLSTRANWTNIWERGLELCSASEADMMRSISANQSSLWQYCFQLPYMASLIEDALCLGDKEVIFGPPDVSWTLGAALIEGEHSWSSSSTTTTTEDNSTLGKIEPVYVFSLLLCLLLVVYYNQIKLPTLSRKASLPSYTLPKHRPN